MNAKALQSYLAELLELPLYKDYGPNGLQVEGKDTIQKIVCGVTACQALIDAAVSQKADAILVHHGLFWQGQDYALKGMLRQRIATLLAHDINLLAYHLPLDAHPELGNNKQLAQQLQINVQQSLSVNGTPNMLWLGEVQPATGEQFAQQIEKTLLRKPLHITSKKESIQRVAWCTGAAQRYIEEALAHNIDAYITGEVSEQTVHTARENNIHFYAAGHHATERYGIQALGQHLAEKFNLSYHFIDIDNPA